MTDSQVSKKGYVKTQTVVLAVFLAFAAGFFSGIVLTILKSGHGPAAGVDPGAGDAMEAARQRKGQIAQLEAMARDNPEDAAAFARLGHAYFDDNRPEEAIEAYRRSLALRPDNADVWTDLGVMYRRNQQAGEAVRAFDRAVEIDPGHTIARFNKGIVLIHDLGQKEAGLKAWKALLAIDPGARSPSGQTVEALVRHFEEHE